MPADYPDAPRYIPATDALLADWHGPVQQFTNGRWEAHTWSGATPEPWYAANVVRLDPVRPEVRDHLIRRLNLPDWMRDGDNLESWQSAGLIACVAAGTRPVGVSRINPICPDSQMTLAGPHTAGWVDETTLINDRDRPSFALVLSDTTMLLPWPDGPRLWRRP